MALVKQSVLQRPGLPPPGLSGVAWLRDAQPKVQAYITPFGHGKKLGSINRAPLRSPQGVLSNPRGPSTSMPLRRLQEGPAERVGRLFARLPDVGGGVGLGASRQVVRGRLAGVPSPPEPLRAGIAALLGKIQPHAGSASESRLIKSAFTLARDKKRPRVLLFAGLGGLDFARAPRLVPDAPSGLREVIRDVASRQRHGTFAQRYTVPFQTGQSLLMKQLALGRGAMQKSPINVDAVDTTAPSGVATPALQESALAPALQMPQVTDTVQAPPENAPAAGGSPSWLPILVLAGLGWMMMK